MASNDKAAAWTVRSGSTTTARASLCFALPSFKPPNSAYMKEGKD